ncbi:MAG: hypothetical protein B6I36_04955 [Desulfobacteraceae bacterium 4572_35.1]|nr:MAG: hypothetical protein B6I36_04955 [Desulfobacteraceae bacterium 4572_35.1]
MPSVAGRPGLLEETGVAPIRGKTIRIARALLVTAVSEKSDRKKHTAYISLNKKTVTGLDGVTWQEYGKEIKTNFSKLHDQIHSGSYRATSSKRIWIAKSDG